MKKRRKPSVQKRIYKARRAGWSEAFRLLLSACWKEQDEALSPSGSDAYRLRCLTRYDVLTELGENLEHHRCEQFAWFGDDPPTNDKP